MAYTEAELVRLGEQLDLLSAEADAALSHQEARSSSVEGRAGLLTGAAAVVGSLQVTTSSSQWVAVVIVLSFIAAGIGVAVVAPRWTYVIDPTALEKAVFPREPKSAIYRVVREKQWLFFKREPAVRRRAVLITIGYVVLALSIIATLVIALTPATTTI